MLANKYVRWIGPALVALLLMFGYQVLVAPFVRMGVEVFAAGAGSLRDDLLFLHSARLQNQAQAAQQQQHAAPKTTP